MRILWNISINRRMDENTKSAQNYFRGNQEFHSTFRPSQKHGRLPLLEENNTMFAVPKEQDHLKELNHIFDTFYFLLSHVVIHQPENPIQYLYQLLDDCILFRAGLKEPRLLWAEKHVDAVFKSSSIFNYSEVLSIDDYKSAMKTLGVHCYDPCPTQCVPGYIDRSTFCTEALNSMKKDLARIVRKTGDQYTASDFLQ